MADGRQMIVETVETKANVDVNKKKHGRGRGHSVSGRGRGSRGNDQTRSQICPPAVSISNGQLENSYHKVCLLDVQASSFDCNGFDYHHNLYLY